VKTYFLKTHYSFGNEVFNKNEAYVDFSFKSYLTKVEKDIFIDGLG